MFLLPGGFCHPSIYHNAFVFVSFHPLQMSETNLLFNKIMSEINFFFCVSYSFLFILFWIYAIFLFFFFFLFYYFASINPWVGIVAFFFKLMEPGKKVDIYMTTRFRRFENLLINISHVLFSIVYVLSGKRTSLLLLFKQKIIQTFYIFYNVALIYFQVKLISMKI